MAGKACGVDSAPDGEDGECDDLLQAMKRMANKKEANNILLKLIESGLGV
jgi:hypothetical protein